MKSHSKATGPGSSPVPSGPGLGTVQVLQFSDCGVTVSLIRLLGGQEQSRSL